MTLACCKAALYDSRDGHLTCVDSSCAKILFFIIWVDLSRGCHQFPFNLGPLTTTKKKIWVPIVCVFLLTFFFFAASSMLLRRRHGWSGSWHSEEWQQQVWWEGRLVPWSRGWKDWRVEKCCSRKSLICELTCFLKWLWLGTQKTLSSYTGCMLWIVSQVKSSHRVADL